MIHREHKVKSCSVPLQLQLLVTLCHLCTICSILRVCFPHLVHCYFPEPRFEVRLPLNVHSCVSHLRRWGTWVDNKMVYLCLLSLLEFVSGGKATLSFLDWFQNASVGGFWRCCVSWFGLVLLFCFSFYFFFTPIILSSSCVPCFTYFSFQHWNSRFFFTTLLRLPLHA